MLDDIPKNANFAKDISFFENEFNGIMPVEIMIDTKRKKGVMKRSTLKRLSKLDGAIAVSYTHLTLPTIA